MAHDHSHVGLGRRLLIGLVINAGMLALQVVGGISANSLGLLSDAAHNGSDVAALGMAYAADRVRVPVRGPRSSPMPTVAGKCLSR